MSDVDSGSGSGVHGYVRCLQICVFVYGIVNILVRGIELVLALISTSIIIAAYVTAIERPHNTFHDYLNNEAQHAIWRGPFPMFVMQVQRNVSSLAAFNSTNATTAEESFEMMLPEINYIQEKLNIHVWTMYFLMKCITFVFAWILVSSVRKICFSGGLAWLAYSTPVLAQYTLQFVLDLSFGDYFLRELSSQIWQGVDVGFQLLGVVLVIFLLIDLYHLDEKIPELDRYNTLPSSRLNGDISIRQIVEDDERFKSG